MPVQVMPAAGQYASCGQSNAVLAFRCRQTGSFDRLLRSVGQFTVAQTTQRRDPGPKASASGRMSG
jgi:hypothetical protein